MAMITGPTVLPAQIMSVRQSARYQAQLTHKILVIAGLGNFYSFLKTIVWEYALPRMPYSGNLILR